MNAFTEQSQHQTLNTRTTQAVEKPNELSGNANCCNCGQDHSEIAKVGTVCCGVGKEAGVAGEAGKVYECKSPDDSVQIQTFAEWELYNHSVQKNEPSTFLSASDSDIESWTEADQLEYYKALATHLTSASGVLHDHISNMYHTDSISLNYSFELAVNMLNQIVESNTFTPPALTIGAEPESSEEAQERNLQYYRDLTDHMSKANDLSDIILANFPDEIDGCTQFEIAVRIMNNHLESKVA